MVQFIKQEANEKAREIAIATEEEFNIEKLSMVDGEKIKIAKEYERKEMTVDTAKKIEESTGRNSMRLKVLSAREQAMQTVLEEARVKLGETTTNAERYRPLLTSLIVQGAKKLGDTKIVVRCRESDVQVAREAIKAASAEMPGSTVTLDESTRLPAAPACVGGVEVTNPSATIICDNTLDARLRIAYERATPEIRATIFGLSGAAAHAREQQQQPQQAQQPQQTDNLISL
jgi:V-type H+-transporting ATPase subunit E